VNLLNLNDTEFHLEFERRKSFLDLGYSSIFSYLVRKLKYSSSTAGRLIQAARCIRANPEVLAMLQARKVSVTSITQVASILDDTNKHSILPKMNGASWREVERVARDYRPPVELRDRIAPVRVATADGSRNMVFVQFLASDGYAELRDGVRGLSKRNMSLGEVSEAALREYYDRHSPVSRQLRREVRKGSAGLDSHRRECDHAIPTSRHIPDEVRDAVWLRDDGQCMFVAPDGTRCGCKRGLEVDHMHPFANHGSHHLSNLRLLCGGHNRLAAEQRMGPHVMRPHWRR
jgi:5-methylcytosine-specific restriction endonuclease McrA